MFPWLFYGLWAGLGSLVSFRLTLRHQSLATLAAAALLWLASLGISSGPTGAHALAHGLSYVFLVVLPTVMFVLGMWGTTVAIWAAVRILGE